MALASRFEDLQAWQEARQLTRRGLRPRSRAISFDATSRSCDQIRRAAVSTMNNIAEGFDSASRIEFHSLPPLRVAFSFGGPELPVCCSRPRLPRPARASSAAPRTSRDGQETLRRAHPLAEAPGQGRVKPSRRQGAPAACVLAQAPWFAKTRDLRNTRFGAHRSPVTGHRSRLSAGQLEGRHGLRSPPPAHPVQFAGRRQQDRESDPAREGARHAGRGDDRPRQHVRRGGVLQDGRGRGRAADHRLRDVRRARRPAGEAARRCAATTSRPPATSTSSCWR